MIATPGQLSRHAEFYHQLAQFTSAGIGLIAALQQLERQPPSAAYRERIGRILSELAHGCTFTEALRSVPGWLPAFDIALLQAGEESGQLDQCLRMLGDYYRNRATLVRRLLEGLAYPVALLHFAIFLLPFPTLFITGNVGSYLASTVGVLLPIYILVALVIYASQGQHGERWRALWEQIVNLVPVLRSGLRSLALARVAAALQALLMAGVTIVQAWMLAADASGSPALRKTVKSWLPQLEAGSTPSELVSASGMFPQLFVSQYAAGEMSGTLEQQLARLSTYYTEEGTGRLRAMAQWTPRIFYIAVVLMIAYRVVKFWTGYFDQINKVIGG